MTSPPKPYHQAKKEAFDEYIANTGGRSEYMKPDFDAGFAAGYNAALHDRGRKLRERAAIAAMQGVLASHKYGQCFHAPSVADNAVKCADALINQLNTTQS